MQGAYTLLRPSVSSFGPQPLTCSDKLQVAAPLLWVSTSHCALRFYNIVFPSTALKTLHFLSIILA